jgi:hypothetical protein
VNISTDSAHVCRSESPAAVEIAPNDTAYAPLAIAMPSASRAIARRGLTAYSGVTYAAVRPPSTRNVVPLT